MHSKTNFWNQKVAKLCSNVYANVSHVIDVFRLYFDCVQVVSASPRVYWKFSDILYGIVWGNRT